MKTKRTQPIRTAVALIAWATILVPPSQACTGITLRVIDGSVVYGR